MRFDFLKRFYQIPKGRYGVEQCHMNAFRKGVKKIERATVCMSQGQKKPNCVPLKKQLHRIGKHNISCKIVCRKHHPPTKTSCAEV